MSALLLPNAKQQFFNGNGTPLSGGRVYFYEPPNTTVLKTTWQDADQTIPNANPVILDGSGEAIIYGTGQYRQIVKDSLGNTIWDQLTTGTGTQNIVVSSQSAGDTNNSSSGSGSFFTHDLTYAIPANTITTASVFRISMAYGVTTGSAAPPLRFALRIGGTTVYRSNGATTPSNNLAGANFVICVLLQGTTVPGATAPVYTNPILPIASLTDGSNNNLPQPVNLATNGDLTLTVQSRWDSAGTGVNTITLQQLVVEALS